MLKKLIKNSIIGICLFGNLFLEGKERNLQELYEIKEECLINHLGQKYPKIAYKDSLHEDLCFVLKDPEQAAIIHQAYLKHILPYIPSEFTESFSKALLKVSVLFGSSHFSPESALSAALEEENLLVLDWINRQKEAFSTFVSQANKPARPNLSQEKDSSFYTVVILTTSASGGNHSVARALEHFLSNFKQIRCIVIDVETIAKESDLVMLATGATTYDGIYAKHYQQENVGMDALIMRDVISKEIGKYIPSYLGLKLKELMRQLHPDLILSTRSYTTDDIPLCTLGAPFRMIHCDYELSFFLMDLYGKVKPEMMKFWIPSLDPQVFQPLFVKAGRVDLYNESDSKAILMEKIAYLSRQSIETIQNQFELLGYPVSPEFYSIEDETEKEKLRNKWNIGQEEIPILISMGKNGVGTLEKIFDELLLSNSQIPTKYFFVCGRNLDLKKRLEEKLLHITSSESKKFAICGLLSPQEMNELMNLCPLSLSKPGGAITSEILEIRSSHLLMLCSHPWEEANGSKIERLGLGQKLQTDQPLALQIEESIKKMDSLKRAIYKNHPWKKLFLHQLEMILNLQICSE